MKIRNLIICLLAVAVFAVPADAQLTCLDKAVAVCNEKGPSVDPCAGGGGWIGADCTSGDVDDAAYVSFVATATTAQIRSDFSTIGTDSHFVIYSIDQADPCNEALWTEIGCSEDECNDGVCQPDAISAWLGKASVCDLTVGDRYMIRVGGWDGSCGPFQIDVNCPNKGSVCGDGIIDVCSTEECDGDDLGSCDYGCNPDCTCSGRPSVPMLPNWGLAGLGLLLLAGGAMVFGRRRSATA